MRFAFYRVLFVGLDPLSPEREWCCRESGLHFWRAA